MKKEFTEHEADLINLRSLGSLLNDEEIFFLQNNSSLVFRRDWFVCDDDWLSEEPGKIKEVIYTFYIETLQVKILGFATKSAESNSRLKNENPFMFTEDEEFAVRRKYNYLWSPEDSINFIKNELTEKEQTDLELDIQKTKNLLKSISQKLNEVQWNF